MNAQLPSRDNGVPEQRWHAFEYDSSLHHGVIVCLGLEAGITGAGRSPTVA